MTRAEALRALHLMLSAAQKSRSTLIETYGAEEAEAVGEITDPWLWGPRCFVAMLAKAIDRYEDGYPIPGAELHNWMRVAQQSPSTLLVAVALNGGEGLPEPELDWYGRVW